jgi:hypothetical protein
MSSQTSTYVKSFCLSLSGQKVFTPENFLPAEIEQACGASSTYIAKQD